MSQPHEIASNTSNVNPALDDEFLSDKNSQSLRDSYEEKAKEIADGGSWQHAVAEFIPNIDYFARDAHHEDLSRGLLARLLEDSYHRERKNGVGAIEFGFGILEVLSELRHVPDSLTRPLATEGQKRQPSFFESVTGTLNRYDFMEKLPDIFADVSHGIVVGGSMGYGPFFSVREGNGKNDPSDIDAIVVLKPDFGNIDSWQQFMSSGAIKGKDKLSLLSRLSTFGAMIDDDTADVLSQRFDVPNHRFNMSTHFMSLGHFERQNGEQLAKDIHDGEDKILVVRDLKANRFEHATCAQRSFDGSIYEYEVPEQQIVTGGLITHLPGYIISDQKYYPGLYQNLVSPEFEPLWDDGTGYVLSVVDSLRKTVIVHVEDQLAKGINASIPKSHIRYNYMAPGRYNNRENHRPVRAVLPPISEEA